MADNEPGVAAKAVNLAFDVANGRNRTLSWLVPPCLFLLDALLCVIVIWKVPCKIPAGQLGTVTSDLSADRCCDSRHRD